MNHQAMLISVPIAFTDGKTATAQLNVCRECSAVVISPQDHAKAWERVKTETAVMTPGMIEEKLATPFVGMAPTPAEIDLAARWNGKRIQVLQHGRLAAVGTVTSVATHHGTDEFTLFFDNEQGEKWQVAPGRDGWTVDLA